MKITAYPVLTIVLLISSFAVAQTDTRADTPSPEGHVGLPIDWSHRHLIFTNSPASVEHAFKASQDPRAYAAFLKRMRSQRKSAKLGNAKGRKNSKHNKQMRVDWAFSMGAPKTNTAIGANQHPAKWIFDPTMEPDCTRDFLVMPVNVAGPQANLIGLNNLYSNSDGTGFCTGKTGPTVLFAYTTGTSGGPNPTSISVSLDGTKVAWIENSTQPKLHVLTLAKSGPGTEGTVAAPISLNPADTNYVEGRDAYVSLTSSTSVTNSSPFVDYTNDVAYVGDDSGHLYRIRNVFCPNDSCSGAGPSLDTAAWAANPVLVDAGVTLTAPVADFATGNIYVGAGTTVAQSHAHLHMFKASTGNRLGGAWNPADVGAGGCPTCGVTDPPILDSYGDGTVALIYSFGGSGGAAAVSQVRINLSDGNIHNASYYNVGSGGAEPSGPFHMGAFNDAYYTSANASEWELYMCAWDNSLRPNLIAIGFEENSAEPRVWPAGLGHVTRYLGALPNSSSEEMCSPLTEFYDAGAPEPHDRLFFSLPQAGRINSFTIDSVPANSTPTGSQQINGTTSGIIVDNGADTGTFAEAASIYVAEGTNGNINNGSCWSGTGAGSLALTGTQSRSGTTGSFTTSVPHGLAIGETVEIAGNTHSEIDGNCTVETTPSTTTFSCTYADSATASGDGGYVQKGTCMFQLSQSALQ